MPRQKVVVTKLLHPHVLHDAAIRKTIKLRSPYAVVTGADLHRDDSDYHVVYRAPLGGDRKVIASRTVRGNAIKLRDMLNEAWAEGMWSSGRNE